MAYTLAESYYNMIIGYVFSLFPMLIWIGMLVKMRMMKLKLDMIEVIVGLEAVYNFSTIVMYQILYSMYKKEGDETISYQIPIAIFTFGQIVSFSLALWWFSFSYWTVSWRLKLINSMKNPTKYN